ncbi:MAG TPA: hypothetical protein VI138_03425 [Candidatus Dormibacteraeota bacterium]
MSASNLQRTLTLLQSLVESVEVQEHEQEIQRMAMEAVKDGLKQFVATKVASELGRCNFGDGLDAATGQVCDVVVGAALQGFDLWASSIVAAGA